LSERLGKNSSLAKNWSVCHHTGFPLVGLKKIQGLFKDFQGPALFSRTFKALKIKKKIPGLSRACGNPDHTSIDKTLITS
jgi:hypothetical protein